MWKVTRKEKLEEDKKRQEEEESEQKSGRKKKTERKAEDASKKVKAKLNRICGKTGGRSMMKERK